MTYVLIGYGTTNSNGVATMTHDKDGNTVNGYTGTGAGELNLVASTDNTITESSLLSETYSILDSIIYIKGDTVTSNLTTNQDITLSVENNYIKMTPSSTNKWQVLNVNSSNNYLNPSNDYIAEFDYILPTNDYCVFTICGANLRLNWGTATEEHHAKVELKDGVAKIYIDENTQASTSGNVTPATECAFGLYSIANLKIKNFKVYPI